MASGPAVSLTIERAQTLALGVHELVTNAVKHGALKADLGQLEVTWTVRQEPQGKHVFVFDWRESELRPRLNSTRRGFGRKLIEQALAFTLQAIPSWYSARMGFPATWSCRCCRAKSTIALCSATPGGVDVTARTA